MGHKDKGHFGWTPKVNHPKGTSIDVIWENERLGGKSGVQSTNAEDSLPSLDKTGEQK